MKDVKDHDGDDRWWHTFVIAAAAAGIIGGITAGTYLGLYVLEWVAGDNAVVWVAVILQGLIARAIYCYRKAIHIDGVNVVDAFHATLELSNKYCTKDILLGLPTRRQLWLRIMIFRDPYKLYPQDVQAGLRRGVKAWWENPEEVAKAQATFQVQGELHLEQVA